jgi:peptidoglycan/LPS O-acetylase OafA/YrhL
MRLGYINGLRGLAILGVVWHHSMLSLLSGPGYPIHVLGLTFQRFPLLTQFYKGVDLFFILSGFVLYLPYVAGKRAMTGSEDAGRFYQRRAQRLLPLFFFAFFLVFSLQHTSPVGSAHFYMELIGVPTMAFQFVNQGFMPPSYGPIWSVGVEILFSAAFPLLILLRRRRSIGWMLGASFLLSVLVQASEARFIWHGLQIGLPQYLFNFVLGMAACEIVLAPQNHRRVVDAIGALGPLLPIVMALCLVAIDIVGKMPLLNIVPNVIFAVAGTLLIVALGTDRLPHLRRLIEVRWLQLPGAMCYSIYLWHLPILFGLFGFGATLTWAGFLPYAPIFLALTFVVSALSYRYIEFPQADFRSLFFLGPRSVATGAQTASPLLEPAAAATKEAASLMSVEPAA